jgi:uncharacterized protein (DUF2062 family)
MRRLMMQGMSPRKIALTLALGVVLGVFPIMGATSLLCAAAAAVLGLNMPAIQAVNYVMYPVQLLLIVPFIRLGEALFRANQTSLTLAQMIALTAHGFRPAVHALWIFAVQGIAAWLLIAPLALGVFYAVFLAVARRIRPKIKRAAEAGA